VDNGDIHFVRDVKVDETKFLFSGSRQGKFIRDDDELLDRERSGPELSSKHNRMMTNCQATTLTMIMMGLMMTSIKNRSSPIGREHHQ
jgi:hypothetical protein